MASIGESRAGNSASHFGEYAVSEQAFIAEGGNANKGTTGNKTISNDVLDNPGVGFGEKGSGSGNKIDQVTNKPVLGIDGQQITVYPGKPKPGAVQEFPSTAKSHGFNDIIDNYAGQATKTAIKEWSDSPSIRGKPKWCFRQV